MWTAGKIPAAPAATDDTVPPLRQILPDPAAENDTIVGPAGVPAASTPGADEPFFWHAPSRPSGEMSNDTRYLCAAAYLSPAFANQVIRNVLAPHRAVVPSAGIDLGPILRHCLNARKLALVRDLALALLLIAGLLTWPGQVILGLVIAFAVGFLMPGGGWHRRGEGGKLRSLLALAAVIAAIIVLLIFAAMTRFAGDVLSFSPVTGGQQVRSSILVLLLVAGPLIAFTGLFGVAQYAGKYAAFRILSRDLRPGSPPIRPGTGPIEARIRAVEAAQWGNVTLYAGEDPFIGSGTCGRDHWSIAIDLGRKASKDDRYVPIDPVELQAAIRQRLLKLNDAALPAGERVTALTVADHVTGGGCLPPGSPLIDSASQIAYSQASGPAMEALIRHPQARLRYYLRASVRDECQPVYVGGQQVIDGVDQGSAVSAFVHVAVEGQMLCLDFVKTSLPPVKRDYQVADRMPEVTTASFHVKVLAETMRTLSAAVIRAPFGIIETSRLMYRESKRQAPACGDFGATLSVRELGAAGVLGSYLGILDADKHMSIIERLVLDTVIEFLANRSQEGPDREEARAHTRRKNNSGAPPPGSGPPGGVGGA
ncbi:MAG TPA: hypothetical protein VMA95_06245 [Streptosporangiaceae bacterium]|nr:hypothetical protein [Streptosporangiaceae bacterium]